MLRVFAGLVGLILFGIISTTPSAYAAPTPDNCFGFDIGSGVITDYYDYENGDPGNPACPRTVEIPTNISGSTVVNIGDRAFWDNQLIGVTIPNSVTNIGEAAFYDNRLTSVVIPDSVTNIGGLAFIRNRLTSLAIPNSVTSVGEYAFQGNRLTSVTIPNSMTSIAAGVFSENKLASLTIPDSVTSISEGAFRKNNLTSLTVPSSVSSIGDYAFSSNKFTSVTVEGNPSSLGTRILSGNPTETILYDGTLYTSAGTNGEACFTFNAGSGEITDFRQADLALIKSDGQACLNKDITIPASIGSVAVDRIGDYAFSGIRLASVAIPNSVTSIGNGAFSENSLTSATIPNSVNDVGDYAFSHNRLTSITIPSSVTNIREGVFMFNSIANVNLPSSVNSVNALAFAAQNQWGGEADDYYLENPDRSIYSDNPSVVQAVLDNMWYTRVYTSSPSNPQNIPDGIMSEWWWTGDVNQNGDQRDPTGGHLINPASATLYYKDEQGNQLQAPARYTGVRTSDNTYLTNYGIVDSAIKAPLDPTNPTPQEASDLAAGFAQYYRSGQTKTFAPPSIAGYIAPAAQTVTFTPGENEVTFTYQKKATPTITVNGDKAITKTPTIPSRPTFSGVATPGSTVIVTVHSDPITCTTTAGTDSKWSCTLPGGLPAGKHTVYVEVTNPDSSMQRLGPYSVVVKVGDGATVLAPDSGVGRSVSMQLWAVLLILGAALMGSWHLIRRAIR
ncbi:MAG TPA: leucine-rich repeat protein [Candidatus Saccharimonadales bacterium]